MKPCSPGGAAAVELSAKTTAKETASATGHPTIVNESSTVYQSICPSHLHYLQDEKEEAAFTEKKHLNRCRTSGMSLAHSKSGNPK